MTKDQVIESLGLQKHIEGGYFKELDKSDIKYKDTTQTLYSSIVFLLGKDDVSHLHILEEDELWYYQGFDDTFIYEIDKDGKLSITRLGLGRDKKIQHLVKRGMIFGSTSAGDNFSLVGCMVSPSFSYKHFKLVSKDDLSNLSKEDFEKVKRLLK